jgi:hypothetical protein
MAGHQPHPRRSAPWEPPNGLLRPPAPQEPPGSLQAPATLRPSAAGPHHSKRQEWPPVIVGRLKCPTNKNNDKIYQMKQ